MPVGAAGVDLPRRSSSIREWRFSMNPSPSLYGRELREICTPLTFETPAGLLLASDSRNFMRAARHAAGSLPTTGEQCSSGSGEGLNRMLMEFGGTQG